MSRLAHPASTNPEAGTLSHRRIWEALDALALRHGMSPSGLAKRAGLDATTFNRSKRKTNDGRLRWPSTESIAKVLDATGSSVEDFLGLSAGPLASALPRIEFEAAQKDPTLFDERGAPSGERWSAAVLPHLDDAGAFALEITGDDLLPVYRAGDLIVVSPHAPVRRGDRIFMKPHAAPPAIAELRRQSGRILELRSLDPAARAVSVEQADWLARIVWCSQ